MITLYNDEVIFPGATIHRFEILSGFRLRAITTSWDAGLRTMSVPHCLCKCECGTLRVVKVHSVKKGLIKSCGCLRDEKIAEVNRHWNCSDVLLQTRWRCMHRRCYSTNESNRRAFVYARKGINVYGDWFDFDLFAEWAYANGWTLECGLELDRKDCNKDYCPDNCQFLTTAEHIMKSALERISELQ